MGSEKGKSCAACKTGADAEDDGAPVGGGFQAWAEEETGEQGAAGGTEDAAQVETGSKSFGLHVLCMNLIIFQERKGARKEIRADNAFLASQRAKLARAKD